MEGNCKDQAFLENTVTKIIVLLVCVNNDQHNCGFSKLWNPKYQKNLIMFWKKLESSSFITVFINCPEIFGGTFETSRKMAQQCC